MTNDQGRYRRDALIELARDLRRSDRRYRDPESPRAAERLVDILETVADTPALTENETVGELIAVGHKLLGRSQLLS
jgi:hypothetical protein